MIIGQVISKLINTGGLSISGVELDLTPVPVSEPAVLVAAKKNKIK